MESVNSYPRVLLICNECLSNCTSNGRTMRKFMVGWPKDRLAQFYVISGTPDFAVCDNYFMVSDWEALQAFKMKKIQNGKIDKQKVSACSPDLKENRKATINKTPITMMARELVWGTGRWKKYGFLNWVDDYKPDVILLQAGDSGFMCNLSVWLSDRFHAPIVIYNSEGYCFKNYDYFRSHGVAHLLYPVFRRYFLKSFNSVIQKARKSVYICEELEQEYKRHYNLPSTTIYTATEVSNLKKENVSSKGNYTVSYLGNMGLGRVDALCEFAAVLHEVNEAARLDIYGKVKSQAVIEKFKTHHNIRYKGFVSYDEVLNVMRMSDLLIHVENFDDFYKEDLKFAFSTKIADSLASGTCFLLYAPESFACTKYLLENQAAYVAVDRSQLKEYLKLLIQDENASTRYMSNAQQLVRANHNAQKNSAAFQHILLEAYQSGKLKE